MSVVFMVASRLPHWLGFSRCANFYWRGPPVLRQ
jgi:hypothetical protein